MKLRIGQGYDVHRLESGRRCVVGGVDIPFEKGLAGHSDADVLIHAICDALLGAANLGDIGRHFPDTDDLWKDADSKMLLSKICAMLGQRGWTIGNIDSTIVAETPRMAPYISGMRQAVADAAGISVEQVSIKATTEEGLGITGKGEAVSAMAIVLISS